MCELPRGGCWLSRVVVGMVAVGLAACGGAALTGPLVPQPPSLEARCKLGAAQSSVLITEWSGAEKANFEAMLGGGAVAVAFSGCELRLVPACRLRGGYTWQRTTPATDYVEIRNHADLYAKLPLGAAALDAELKRSGALTVSTTVAGQRRLGGMTAAEALADPTCGEATHVVDAVTLGAYALHGGGDATGSVGVDVRGVGQTGGAVGQSLRVVRSAGQPETCAASRDDGPDHGCASPIRVFLTPIPGRGEPVGPPGTVRVDFVSASATTRWDVYVEDQATCTAPCSVWVDPTRPLAMRVRDQPGQRVQVRRIPTDLGPVQVTARPQAMGKFATGITFTALGGMGVVAGVTLTAVGCSTDRDGMCTAGIITAIPSALVTAGAIWLIRRSLPKVHVGPVFSDVPMGVRF